MIINGSEQSIFLHIADQSKIGEARKRTGMRRGEKGEGVRKEGCDARRKVN